MAGKNRNKKSRARIASGSKNRLATAGASSVLSKFAKRKKRLKLKDAELALLNLRANAARYEKWLEEQKETHKDRQDEKTLAPTDPI